MFHIQGPRQDFAWVGASAGKHERLGEIRRYIFPGNIEISNYCSPPFLHPESYFNPPPPPQIQRTFGV